ncbi:MAG: enoyl-CoA hydratase [Alphaproteobacteria bacterium]|nr:enoyl-CoA hydratase [Alphaproteobacteria bacterium]
MTDSVLTRRDGAVRWLVFNKPEKHNALSMDMTARGLEIVQAFAEADEERVLVVAGAGGKAFVSGADISEFESRRNNAETADEYARTTARFFFALRDVEKPTVAMIEGYCFGGGVALACCCDIRIAAETGLFAIPAARLGIGYSADFVKMLADLVGPSFAKEFLYTARRYPAGEAQAIGLINRIVPAAELERHVQDYAQAMAGNAPLTQRAAKIVVSELYAATGDGTRGRAAVAACADSEDFRDARRAFMEKRKPVFHGK